MRRRSNLLVLLGLASFVLGLLAVYLFTKDDDSGNAATDDTVEVVVAAADLPAGTNGDQILQDASFHVERIPRADLTPDLVTAPSQLSGTVLTLTFAEGEKLRLSGLRSLGTGIRPQIPEGYEALTVQTNFVAGGAQTINPGDRVNLYLVLGSQQQAAGTTGTPPPYTTPRAELLLANVPVLDVQVGTSPLTVNQAADPSSSTATQSTATGGSLVFVVAVDTLDAEKIIFGETSGQLFFSRVRLDDQGNPPPPIDATPGRDFLNILEEEAKAALDRQTPIP